VTTILTIANNTETDEDRQKSIHHPKLHHPSPRTTTQLNEEDGGAQKARRQQNS